MPIFEQNQELRCVKIKTFCVCNRMEMPLCLETENFYFILFFSIDTRTGFLDFGKLSFILASLDMSRQAGPRSISSWPRYPRGAKMRLQRSWNPRDVFWGCIEFAQTSSTQDCFVKRPPDGQVHPCMDDPAQWSVTKGIKTRIQGTW